MAGLVSIIYVNRKTITSYFENIDLELTTNEVIIEANQQVDVGQYVKSYSKTCQLVLPVAPDTSGIGERLLEYKVSNGVKSITRKLKIIIKDNNPPSLILKGNSVSLDKGVSFHYKDYIQEALDDEDGNLIERVECDTTELNINKEGRYYVTYKVADNFQNATTKRFMVIINEKKEEKTSSSKTETQNQSVSSNANADQSTSITDKSKLNKTFMFVDGYDMKTGKEKAVEYANSIQKKYKLGSKVEIITENGLKVGFKVTVK